jgi:hypothetical protein
MKADYSRFNLKPPVWIPGDPVITQHDREQAEVYRKQALERLELKRMANKSALSTPLLIALWAFFEKEGQGWSYAKQDGTEVSFDGDFDLKDLVAAIEEALK